MNSWHVEAEGGFVDGETQYTYSDKSVPERGPIPIDFFDEMFQRLNYTIREWASLGVRWVDVRVWRDE